jgi:hypothetical protein
MSDIHVVVENAHVFGCGVTQELNAVKSHYRLGQVLRALGN